MRSETWLARLVFALGALVMIATSAPRRWGATEKLEAQIESEGQGDDKLLRIHLRMTDGVARDAGSIWVRMQGTVDRPASDLTIAWHGESDSMAAANPSFSTSDDFLTVYTDTQNWHGCRGSEPCELSFEARIAAQSSEAYAMDLAIDLTISGSKGKRPQGEIQATVEVLDAP